jgi:retron-type reverse transcriptase
MLERGNMLKALQAVEANHGAAGIDGMEVGQLRGYLRKQWAEIKEQILNGNYEPRPVRRVDIPKPGGGTRRLGIPTVTDRMRKLIALGLDRGHARERAFNGHGPWWNAGASHLNAALPTACFRRMGLISLMEAVHWFTWLREQRSL